MGYFRNTEYTITGKNHPVSLKTDSLGNFCYEIETSYPIWFSPTILDKHCRRVLLVPSEELVMDIDLPTLASASGHWFYLDSAQLEGIRFQGKYAALNKAFWRRSIPSISNAWRTTPFSRHTEWLWESYQNEIQKIQADQTSDEVHKKYMHLFAQRRYIERRISYLDEVYRFMEWNPKEGDSLLLKTREQEFTFEDPHAHELFFFESLNSALIVADTSMIAYMEANRLTGSPYYKWAVELKQAQNLVTRINAMQPVTEEGIWERIAPQYVQVLKQLNDTVLKSIEAIKQGSLPGRVYETPSVEPEQLLSAITARFKGKVVLIDCWATWCGPCLRGIEDMKPMKKELAGQDVAFVYLTNESSTAAEWTEKLKEIDGEHYRIPDAIWNKLPDVEAIPQYFIFDRNGNRILEETGWSDKLLDKFKNTIVEALGK